MSLVNGVCFWGEIRLRCLDVYKKRLCIIIIYQTVGIRCFQENEFSGD